MGILLKIRKRKIVSDDTLDIINNCILDINRIKENIEVSDKNLCIKFHHSNEFDIFEEVMNWKKDYSVRDFS